MSRALLALLAFLAVGCDDTGRTGAPSLDVEDPDFKQGQIFHKQGETRRALECFLKVIDSRKNAAESHLEAGRMHLDLGEPLSAIYHFNQYVRLKPGSQQAPMVKQMIRTAEKQFMKQLPGQPMEPDAAGSVDLNGRLRALQMENDRLKKELSEYTRLRPSDPAPPSRPTPTPPAAASGRTYTVVAGDNPTRISVKMFGNGSRANDIMKANREKVPNPLALKPGMVLVIPE
ncbi:MAG: LysM peptidoglycan-binding domain-containing protein [Verrucomicrobiota bacterium]